MGVTVGGWVGIAVAVGGNGLGVKVEVALGASVLEGIAVAVGTRVCLAHPVKKTTRKTSNLCFKKVSRNFANTPSIDQPPRRHADMRVQLDWQLGFQ